MVPPPLTHDTPANNGTRAGTRAVTLDIAIVSYRCRELLRCCLRSLRENPSQSPTTVYVVDNASGDGTLEMLGEEFPEVTTISVDENLGFARAANRAIRAGTGKYILTLNPDTRLTRGTLDHLLHLMEANPQVGMAGCKLELEDGSIDHASARSFPTLLGTFGHFTGLAKKNVPARLAQYHSVQDEAGAVDTICGAFMLIRRDALRKIGLFDPGYWMYIEDIDLCYRFAEAGWLVWYEPDVATRHVKGGASPGERSPRVLLSFHRGMARFYRKHYARRHHTLTNAAVYGAIYGKCILALARREVRELRIP